MTTDDNNVGFISMHDFLDFLKITCHVNESIENKNIKDTNFDYDKLAKNDFINNVLVAQIDTANTNQNVSADKECSKLPLSPMKEKSNNNKPMRKRSVGNLRTQKSKTETSEKPQIVSTLNEKLDEVINEGILDSVLPFICSQQHPAQPTVIHHQNSSRQHSRSASKASISINSVHNNQKSAHDFCEILDDKTLLRKSPRPDGNNTLQLSTRNGRRKSSAISPVVLTDGKPDGNDVIIHVCDEVKNMSRDFVCPQKILVRKMGYFADVTSGQKLEDMDISVHCDLQIFEWLMKWVRKDTLLPEDWPLLDPTNVVPILVSASFLQMEPLLLDCLSFCHARLTDVVKASANLSCLNDSIITRLAAMFTNLELETVKDRKDRITPRLWTKMIQSLCETESQALRGHYASLASLFRCNRCGKYVTQTISSYVYCLPQNMRINRWGQLISQHVKDTSWNITNYVSTLYKEMRSWRKVYWRLWGHCHFLYCVNCETHFPVFQMNWCQYHPDQPQYLGPISEGRTPGPAGRYPCCGQHAFRYETLPGSTGCQFREHSVLIENDKDRAILELSNMAGEGGCLYELPINKSISLNAESWWNGITLVPHRTRQGLLPSLHIDDSCNKNHKKNLPKQNTTVIDSSSDSESSERNHKNLSIVRQLSSSSDGGESEYSSPRNYRVRPTKRRMKRLTCGRFWSGEMSARSNQDNQREFEERAMKQVIAMVGKKTGSDINLQYQNYQQGGTYVKLESEWRENIKQRSSTKMIKK